MTQSQACHLIAAVWMIVTVQTLANHDAFSAAACAIVAIMWVFKA